MKTALATLINRQKMTLNIWKKFINGEPLGKHDVPSYIINGWKLSKKYKIDPLKVQTPTILSTKQLEALREENSLLLHAAEPMLKLLAASIRNTGYIATFTVRSGYLLAVVGDDELLKQANLQYNVVGADRSIQSIGASALTLAMIEKRLVCVQGAEHYNKFWHNWSCAAAPIFDFNENVIASLALSSEFSYQDNHIPLLAQSCADGISSQLRELILLENEKRLNAVLESVHNALPELVITVNNLGKITHANRQAINYFGFSSDLIDKTLKDLFSKTDCARAQKLLKTGKTETVELEVISNHGARNFICRFLPISTKNSDLCGMTIFLSKHTELLELTRHVSGNYAKYSFADIKGENKNLKEQITLATRAAKSSHRILLFGESGTGKELFAQSIHNESSSYKGPFVAISCAAIPRDLIESELFGYVGGAFTGARRNGMIGKIELATNGTLFLDEINSLPLEMQAKLLRVLQQMEIVRIGDSKPTPINARIIAATNKNLKDEVSAGQFREDLFFRLNVIEINIPPLRERKDDISLLANLFLHRQGVETSHSFQNITDDALESLYNYNWPGNIRELENVCERALLLSENGIILQKHLPAHIVNNPNAKLNKIRQIQDKSSTMQENMQDIILRTLNQHNGNISKAAKQLGVARSTLHRKIKQFHSES